MSGQKEKHREKYIHGILRNKIDVKKSAEKFIRTNGQTLHIFVRGTGVAKAVTVIRKVSGFK